MNLEIKQRAMKLLNDLPLAIVYDFITLGLIWIPVGMCIFADTSTFI